MKTIMISLLLLSNVAFGSTTLTKNNGEWSVSSSVINQISVNEYGISLGADSGFTGMGCQKTNVSYKIAVETADANRTKLVYFYNGFVIDPSTNKYTRNLIDPDTLNDGSYVTWGINCPGSTPDNYQDPAQNTHEPRDGNH